MKNRIFRTVAMGMCVLLLSNCSTLYQSSQMTKSYEAPLPSGLSAYANQNTTTTPTNNGEGWGHLMMTGPGNDALITMNNVSLRGGTIVQVNQDSLTINSANKNFTIARSDIAVVEIQGSSGALAGGIIVSW